MITPSIRERGLEDYELLRFGEMNMREDAERRYESKSEKVLNKETKSILFYFYFYFFKNVRISGSDQMVKTFTQVRTSS